MYQPWGTFTAGQKKEPVIGDRAVERTVVISGPDTLPNLGGILRR